MIQLVVFDIAGTTVHDGDAVRNAFMAATQHAGLAVEPLAIRHVMGLPKPVAIQRLLEAAQQPSDPATVERIHADFVVRMQQYYATDQNVHEIEGARTVFETLRAAGIRVTLNSGFSRPIVDILLRRLGWDETGVLDGVLTSDEVLRGRPHPDMIQHLMAHFHIERSQQVAKVGDTQADLEEGTNAACGLVIGVTTGSYTREQLQEYPHTHIVESVRDVPKIILAPA